MFCSLFAATVIPAELLHFVHDNSIAVAAKNATSSPDNGRKRRHRFAPFVSRFGFLFVLSIALRLDLTSVSYSRVSQLADFVKRFPASVCGRSCGIASAESFLRCIADARCVAHHHQQRQPCSSTSSDQRNIDDDDNNNNWQVDETTADACQRRHRTHVTAKKLIARTACRRR